METTCRVCGLELDTPAWIQVGGGLCPTYDICPCCGAEFGLNDASPAAVRAYRQQWISQGAPWTSESSPPRNWDVRSQLRHVPDRWR